MKLKLIAVALSVSLVACVSTEETTAKNSSSLVQPASVLSPLTNADVVKSSGNVITLEQIMADPDWFGRAPEAWYWGDDSHTIFYKQKQLGNPLRDLWVSDLSNNSEAKKVALSEHHQVVDVNAKQSSDGKFEIYSFEGNIFVKELASKSVKQVTYTSADERDALFLSNANSDNNKIAYRIDDVFYSHDLVTGQVIELANLQMTEEPEKIQEPTSYLAKEQHKLINYIALQQRNNQLKAQQKSSLEAQNTTVTTTKYYFGEGNKVSHASLSPNGDKLFVSIAAAKSSRNDTDIMPNYVTKDGVITTEKVRSRVADNRQYKESLFFIDLKTGRKVALSYETLPNFDTDVLASVKKENFARNGKKYKSTKTPRNIHLLQMLFPVKWNEDGSEVALMLEAWDNKTRWLTTIDFENETLINQHELYDDAWINWRFNEFDWVGNEALYYLSEESGYSHLYYKALDAGKALQLTSGKYEVSDVTLTKDQQRFIFKANQKHPGIYEIYQVDLAKSITALTDLGGTNNYSLSPDESLLLIEHSSLTMPPELYIQALNIDAKAKQVTYTVSEQFKALPWVSPSVVAISSSNQKEPIYSRVYLPENYDVTQEKNRAVMFTHGAGYLQNSHLGWSGYFREFMFHSMLVQQGYVVIDMDYRASAGYGRDWRTSIYRHMGKVEVEDMRDGVQWMVENANVDPKRVGTYGGSYGGFLTLMSMFTDPTLFESGSAIRLVSDWAYYNHDYTSNILNTPADDAIAYERSSPIYFAEGLTKPLLINAPMVDDNVFFEDTVRLVQRLIELEKVDFETAIYPVEPHGFVQPSSWLNEYRRIYKLFENTL